MKVKLVNVRLCFPELFQAREYKTGDGRPRYSATFLLEKNSENTKLIEAAIKSVATEAWKDKAEAVLGEIKGNGMKFCLSNGDAKQWNGAEGKLVLASHRSSADGRPGTFGPRGGSDPVTAEDGVLYGGCYVNATVDIWAQVKNEGAPAIRCGLIGVQFAGHGEAFGGASAVDANDFEDLTSGASAGGLVD